MADDRIQVQYGAELNNLRSGSQEAMTVVTNSTKQMEASFENAANNIKAQTQAMSQQAQSQFSAMANSVKSNLQNMATQAQAQFKAMSTTMISSAREASAGVSSAFSTMGAATSKVNSVFVSAMAVMAGGSAFNAVISATN